MKEKGEDDVKYRWRIAYYGCNLAKFPSMWS